jgi:hypothetical protein
MSRERAAELTAMRDELQTKFADAMKSINQKIQAEEGESADLYKTVGSEAAKLAKMTDSTAAGVIAVSRFKTERRARHDPCGRLGEGSDDRDWAQNAFDPGQVFYYLAVRSQRCSLQDGAVPSPRGQAGPSGPARAEFSPYCTERGAIDRWWRRKTIGRSAA